MSPRAITEVEALGPTGRPHESARATHDRSDRGRVKRDGRSGTRVDRRALDDHLMFPVGSEREDKQPDPDLVSG